MYMGRMGALFGKMGRVALLGSAAAQALALNGGYGLSMFAIDNSMVINDASTPANNFIGLPSAKLTTTRASSATYWDSSGVLRSASSNVLRRDFDPRLASTTEKCGFLIEEARTNLALRSEEFDNAAWSTSNTTITANQAVAPDGTTTADLAVPSTGNNAKSVFTTTGLTVTAAVHSWSIFVKNAGYNFAALTAVSNTTTRHSIVVNLTTGAITATNTQGSPSNVTTAVTLCSNGWVRIVVSMTASSSANVTFLAVHPSNSGTPTVDAGCNPTFAGDGVSGIYIWGAQVELGSFASSYIPTAGSTVTRAADLVTLAGTLFPLSQTEGTLYAKFMCMGQDTSYILDIDASNNEAFYLARLTTNKVLFGAVDGGVQQFPSNGFESTASLADLTQGRIAGAYKLNDSAAALIGETVQTDIVCTMPTTTTLVLGNRSTGAREIGGWIFEAAYFPTRKTNSQLQALASGYASDALLLMGAETQGLTFSASDQSMSILDTTTAANNYTGELSAKLGSIRTSAGMTYLSSGLLGWGPENRFLRSQEFDLSWSKVNCSVIANDAIAPDGTMTADRITYSAQFSHVSQAMSVVVGETYTLSVWLKSVSGPGTVTLMVDYGAGTTQLSNVTITSDWVRYTHTFTAVTAVSTNPAIGIQERNPSSFDVIHAWGAQLERASSASDYKPTGAAAYYGLRLDYDSRLTGGPGYLVEEARTNLVLQSQTLGTTWAATRASVSADATAAPDGTTTADKLVEDGTAANNHNLSQGYANFTSGTTYALSIYAKKAERERFLFQLPNSAFPANAEATFNLNTGVVASTGAGASSASIQALANGWYRCTVIAVCDATTSGSYVVYLDDGSSASYNGDGTSGAYFWGAQLEAGAFATSYIPTTTASVTRAADIPTLSTTLYNKSWPATMYARFITGPAASISGGLLSEYSTGAIQLAINSGPNITAYSNGTANGNRQSAATVAALTKYRAAAGFDTNNLVLCLNGTNTAADSTVDAPNIARTLLYFGYEIGGAKPLNGWLTEGGVWPRRFSDAELQLKAAA